MRRVLKFAQSDKGIKRNISFFKENRESYNRSVQELDTYGVTRRHLNEALRGIDRLLDIGNGGVFDYDINVVNSIVALDLFLEDLPVSFSCPTNVTLKNGSAVNITEPDESFDGVLISMVLHHLIGKTVHESLENVHQAVLGAFRVLRPGGKLIILESCVPEWFYLLEKAVFSFATKLINKTISHPTTLQYPAGDIARVLSGLGSSGIEIVNIPKGRWVLQYGFKFPAVLTPINIYMFVVHK